MKVSIYWIIGLAFLSCILLPGCTTTPDRPVGTYEFNNGYAAVTIEFSEDGTWHASDSAGNSESGTWQRVADDQFRISYPNEEPMMATFISDDCFVFDDIPEVQICRV